MVTSAIWFATAIICFCVLVTESSYYPYDEENSKELEDDDKTLLTVSVGEYVILNCDIDYPKNIEIPYVLEWIKDGEKVFTKSGSLSSASGHYKGRISPLQHSVVGMGKGSINLTSIRESDGGWYHCKVSFPNRTPSTRNNGTWIHLTVNDGYLIMTPPINQTVMEGEEIHLSCLAKETGTEVTWKKDGMPLNELPDILHRSSLSKEGSLTIHSASMADLGEYECIAKNTLGERQNAKAYVNVLYKARVVYAPKQVYLPYGKPGSLDCHYRSNPSLTTLKWEKDGFLFDPFNVPGVFLMENGSLFFGKVDDLHAGIYTCTPYNELGTEGSSSGIEVIVLRPPTFVHIPLNLYLKKLGETVEMPCDARDGANGHRPIIVWYKKDGSSLPEGRYMIKEGNLTIINIQEKDRGVYQCSASNEAATISAETELVVENVQPRAPYNLTAKASKTAVHLKWIAGRRRPRIKYSIWYKPTNAQEWKTQEVHQDKIFEATIKGLIPACEYEFMVLSEDPQGESIFSKSLKIWTLDENGEIPEAKHTSFNSIGAPNGLTIRSTEEGYLLTWNPPDIGLDNLRVYLVKWYQGSSEYLISTAETTNTSFIISDLEEGDMYHFEVIAVTFNNDQAPSEKLRINIPSYGKIGTVSISLMVFVIFILIVLVGLYYGKSKICPNFMKNKKIQENRV